jgi:fructosamine-3-kinase
MTWQAELAATLGEVASIRRVPGGDINEAFRVVLADGRTVFAKHRADVADDDVFAAEMWGLQWLSAGPLRVPGALAVGRTWLALEWLELDGTADPTTLGRQLAELHRIGAPSFGLGRPTYLATLPLDNRPCQDVVAFWIEQRLRPLAARAEILGRAPNLGVALDHLRARADRFGPVEPPARLHGDLWWGNVGAVRGRPAVFDPAVYGGPREVDLAMLALFGGLPERLVDAYAEVQPLSPGWRERLPLWQLCPLLVHAVLFGGSYGGRAARELSALG